MSGKHSRNKGARFERAMGKALAELYPGAARGIDQRRHGAEDADVINTPWWVECKHHKVADIKAAYRQATRDTDGRPVLIVTKDDRKPVLVTMEWCEFARLVQKGQGE